MTPDQAALRSWTWTAADGTVSNDWNIFTRRLHEVAARRGFEVQDLGPVGDGPLLQLTRRAPRGHGPRLLLASGFHGEEPAGPWGVLSFLGSADDALLDAADLTVLPLVNVTGFRAGRRFNDWGENPNRGYLPGDEPPTREGLVLLGHQAALARAADDGLLACHEDLLLTQAYLYSLEREAAPGPLSCGLRDVNASYFPLHPDGEVDGCPVRDGIVFNHRDTSFETWLFDCGARRAATVETPGQQPFDRRVAAQAAMMRRFVELSAAS